MDFPKIKNQKEKLIDCKIIPTNNRLTFDITWQHPETRYMGEGDNEIFINMLADIVGTLTKERDELKSRLRMEEHRIIELENGED